VTARRLVLIRHAKAEQGGRDIERPLARRGRDDARAIGEWLADHAMPDVALVSPSVRTRQTWQCAVAALPCEPALVVDDRIYDNAADALAEAIRGSDASAETLALVGHNPSVQAVAARAQRRSDEGMEALLSFPTSTVALLEMEGSWRTFDPRAATLIAVDVCRGRAGGGLG
jgi:phosphohistidine phosphatase